MVMIDLNDYMNSIADKYSNVIGHASDHEEVNANSYHTHEGTQVPGYDEILPCACEDCLEKFLLEMEPLNDLGMEDYEGQGYEEFLAEDLDEATMEVIENLAFLGDGTTSRDVMSALLGLEATITLIKRFLLDREE